MKRPNDNSNFILNNNLNVIVTLYVTITLIHVTRKYEVIMKVNKLFLLMFNVVVFNKDVKFSYNLFF